MFHPLMTRDEYTNRVMKEMKSSFFGNSFKSMLSFFVKQEEVLEEDLNEIIEIIKSNAVKN